LIEKAALDYFEKGLEYYQDSKYEHACKEYKKSIEYNSKSYATFNNWGAALADLAKLNSDEELYKQSIEKYKIATELNPKADSTFFNWGTALLGLAELNSDEELYKQSIEKHLKAVELGGKSYNLSCAYALIKDKTKALEALENSLQKKEIKPEYVEKDEDWQAFWNDPDFIQIIDKFRLK